MCGRAQLNKRLLIERVRESGDWRKREKRNDKKMNRLRGRRGKKGEGG